MSRGRYGSLAGDVTIFVALLAIVLVTACGGGITPADTALVAVETEQQRECVDAFLDAGPVAQDGCRAKVRATWNTYWANRFGEGGVDGSDN